MRSASPWGRQSTLKKCETSKKEGKKKAMGELANFCKMEILVIFRKLNVIIRVIINRFRLYLVTVV